MGFSTSSVAPCDGAYSRIVCKRPNIATRTWCSKMLKPNSHRYRQWVQPSGNICLEELIEQCACNT